MNKLLKNMLTGIGSVLVIAPPASAIQLNRDDYLAPSDAHAIHGAWVAVGNDLKKASGKVADGSAK